MTTNKAKIDSFLTRGVENIIPGRSELVKLLNSGKKLNIYMGVDATATRIHLGHAFNLRKLQILADLGHNVTFLIGDFTAKIGDTSDKESERPVLSDEEIANNFKTYKEQASKFLDFDKVTLRQNSEWLSELNFAEVLKIIQNFSLNDFISRELIKKRLLEGKSVGLLETLYPIMQGYDSFVLDTDIQIGATDQTFNMQAGRTLLKNWKNKESFVVTSGFLPGTDGRKMSKSWGNAVWVEDSAEEIFGKIMSIADEVIETYLLMGTSMEMEEIEGLKNRLKKGENPMEIKKILADQVVRELWGEDYVQKAREYFQSTVVEKKATEETNVYKVSENEMGILVGINGQESLVEVLVDAGLVASKSEFKRLWSEGAIYLDEKRVETSVDKVKLHDGVTVVRIGKRKYLKLEV